MYAKNIFVGLLACLLLSSVHSRSLTECPNIDKPGALVEIAEIQKSFLEPIHLRIPEIGVLETDISCILATDLVDSLGGPIPIISSGGVGYPYVQIEVYPFNVFERLHFRFEIYRNTPTTTVTTTTL